MLDEVQECINELAKNGQIDGNAQPVVFVVGPREMDGIGRIVSAAAMPLAAPMLLMPFPPTASKDDDD